MIQSENNRRRLSQTIREVSLTPTQFEEMKQQNDNLKIEIAKMAEQMDDHVQKYQESMLDNDYPEEYHSRNRRQSELMAIIAENRTTILNLKKQLEQTYDFQRQICLYRIIENEDKIKLLKKQLDFHRDESYSLIKESDQLDQVLEEVVDHGNYLIEDQEEKLTQLLEDLKEIQKSVKEKEIELSEKDKKLRLLHEQYIAKESKIKEIETKLVQKKNKKNKDPKVLTFIKITQELIDNLQKDLVKIRAQREVVETEGTEKISLKQQEKENLQNKLKEVEEMLKLKKKNLKINKLKISEIQRFLKLNQDSSQFIILVDPNEQEEEEVQEEVQIQEQIQTQPKVIVAKYLLPTKMQLARKQQKFVHIDHNAIRSQRSSSALNEKKKDSQNENQNNDSNQNKNSEKNINNQNQDNIVNKQRSLSVQEQTKQQNNDIQKQVNNINDTKQKKQ